MENTNINIEIDKDDSSDEETENDLIQTDVTELNSLDNKENDYLLVGIFGNGSGFLKSSLYSELKAGTNSYKFKFMSKLGKDKTRAKKVSGEVYQFTENNVSNLVLHTKENLTDQSYKYVLDYLKTNGITYKRVAIFDSTHISSLVGLESEESKLYCLKNSMQLRSNQLIRAKDLPVPNTVGNFAAYLLTYHEFVDVPCVVYLAVSNLYEVCLDSVRIFNEATVAYAFLRDRLSEGYLTEKQISNNSIQTLFKEFNSFKNLVYS